MLPLCPAANEDNSTTHITFLPHGLTIASLISLNLQKWMPWISVVPNSADVVVVKVCDNHEEVLAIAFCDLNKHASSFCHVAMSFYFDFFTFCDDNMRIILFKLGVALGIAGTEV